ncbi:exocyst complex component [Nesidiocoris tenuis]|uniref:Exocyst complex component 2 n=1 Tax=Nesidiocoris tenuis TaxID=355587 RepID=A0ABN7BB84_9HEMI|nr:exocyst complex component [Nesidiocoris tenuis]
MPSPVVTGVSPKEGPPGTRVTIRGENLGTKQNDILGVEICGCDCTLSTEWKSPNKIIARSGPGKGRGQIVITTSSGGRGSCTVEFRGYFERIGPLKESAVWVEEASPIGPGPWSKGTTFHMEDPLGLSVEADDTKKLPEDDLQDLFPGCNGDLSSEQFSPGWFLLQHHQSTSFDDLRVGLAYLKRKVDGHKEGQLSFLKGNVSSVMEQLEVLEALQAAFQKDIDDFGNDKTGKIVDAIMKSKEEGRVLFDGVLKGKEKADRTRNALGVLQRFRFLFTLPAAIDRSMQRSDYDAIISDYSRANNLFGKTEVNLFKQVLAEVKLKVIEIKSVLKTKLHTMPTTLEAQKKIIRNLVQLEYEGDPGWEAINVHVRYINGQLNDCYKFHMANLEKLGSPDPKSKGKRDKNLEKQNSVTERVDCIEDLCDIISLLLPELWSLGQSYFSGDLYMKPDQNKLAEFKSNTLACISEMCRLVRTSVGQGKSPLVGWFPHCLQCLRAVASQLSQIPHDPLTALIHHFRMECVKSVLVNAAEQVKELAEKENWSQVHEPSYGLITQLPGQFKNVVETAVTTLKESALQKEAKEAELFDSDPLQKEAGHLVLGIFNNYIQVIDQLSANGEEEQMSFSVSQMGATTFRQNQTSLSWEEKLLSCICNVKYSEETVLPGLCTSATAAGLPPLEWVLREAVGALGGLRSRLEFMYIEAKSDPLVGTIEPSMYIGYFDWDEDLPPKSVRPYANEIIANLIGVHAQLERSCNWMKDSALTQIVETVTEEVSRLILCAARMSHEGAMQANLDIAALKYALARYTSENSQRFLAEALEAIPPLDNAKQKKVQELFENYKTRMHLQLYAFTQKR